VEVWPKKNCFASRVTRSGKNQELLPSLPDGTPQAVAMKIEFNVTANLARCVPRWKKK
jgi:hypothetical protein